MGIPRDLYILQSLAWYPLDRLLLAFQPLQSRQRGGSGVQYLLCIPKALDSIASTTESETKGYQRYRLYLSTGEVSAGGSNIQDQPGLSKQKEKTLEFYV